MFLRICNYLELHCRRHIRNMSVVKVCSGNSDTRSWYQPVGKSELKLLNSLTKEKNEFIPQNGRQVLWYGCGPTVYDASHMGHARSYITFDILRRVLSDYFNYDVFYVMNVTDVDDKIINRARKNHLVGQYRMAGHPPMQILCDISEALKLYEHKVNETTDPDIKNMQIKIMRDATDAKDSVKDHLEIHENQLRDLLDKASEPLADFLDKQFGSTVTDFRIFTELPQYWEREFHDDMKALDVLPADVLTRVSEYIPECVAYTQKIIDNGYAYESNGSVYFDTIKFASSDGHEYAKLVPEAVSNLQVLQEAEGELCKGGTTEKRSERDFALWKASKPGEPSWASPWGQGRPGWHLECSVMASDVLGQSIDVHTGGVDLKFPHHDNELAQAEAYFCHNQWVHYFLHAGHLTIEGCKMSKSLKNFVTIKDALKKNSSRQIRLMFLLHAWNSTLDYSANVLREAVQVEKLFADFFLCVKDILRKPQSVCTAGHNFRGDEKEMFHNFTEKKRQIHLALCDSVDTACAMQHMQALVKQTNIYINAKKQVGITPNHSVIECIAKYLTRMFKIFGANTGEQVIGFPSDLSPSGWSNREEIVMPFVNLIAEFREGVRSIAMDAKVGKILTLCDDLRDSKLIDIGVKLEDQEAGLPVVKLVDRETLLKERQEKLEEIERKRREKEEAKLKQAKEKAEKDAKAKVAPADMFRMESDKYSQFDAQGLPTHDASGAKLSASSVKKLKKMYAAQEKLHAKYLGEQSAG